MVMFSYRMVMSSAYVNICVLSLSGCGTSFVKRMKRVGERAEHCGTPALDENDLEKQFLCVILYVLWC